MKNKVLASKYGLSLHQVSRLKRKHNVKHPQKKTLTNEQKDKMIEMLNEGKTLNDMGKEFDVVSQTAKKILNELGYYYHVEKKRSYEDMLSESLIESYITDYQDNNMTIKNLQNKYGVGNTTHYNILNKHNVGQRSPRLENQLNEDELKQLEKDINEGMYATHLAKKYSVWTDKIQRYAEKNNLPLIDGNDERRFNYNEDEIIELFDQGLLIKEIAEKLDKEYHIVQYVLNQHGKSRSESEVHGMLIEKGMFTGGGYRGQLYPYKGYKMRSNWEINVAKYLDENNYKWKYEMNTFKLGDFRYTPDFFILDENGEIDFIIEVKGWVREKDIRKLQLMDSLYPEYPIVFMDKKPYKKIEKEVLAYGA